MKRVAGYRPCPRCAEHRVEFLAVQRAYKEWLEAEKLEREKRLKQEAEVRRKKFEQRDAIAVKVIGALKAAGFNAETTTRAGDDAKGGILYFEDWTIMLKVMM